jgi:hypothetical protein
VFLQIFAMHQRATLHLKSGDLAAGAADMDRVAAGHLLFVATEAALEQAADKADLLAKVAGLRQQLDPLAGDAHAVLGTWCKSQGDEKAARKHFDVALQLLPANHPLREMIAEQMGDSRTRFATDRAGRPTAFPQLGEGQ